MAVADLAERVSRALGALGGLRGRMRGPHASSPLHFVRTGGCPDAVVVLDGALRVERERLEVSRTAWTDRCRGGQTDPVNERDQVARIGPNGARRSGPHRRAIERRHPDGLGAAKLIGEDSPASQPHALAAAARARRELR